VGNIIEILPFHDPVIVLQMEGSTLWAALENALGAWPAQEGSVTFADINTY
jgi:5'-nucleotidase